MTYYSYYSYQDPRPRIISNGGRSFASLHIKENTRFVTDVQTRDNRSTESNGRLSYFIVGGSDKNLFEIDRRTGKLFFKTAPDYENPLDYGRNNAYDVKVKVVDAAGYSDTQTLRINVKNVAEVDFNPSIVSNGGGSSAHVEVSENSTFVTDVQTVDNISTEANGRLSYFIEGGVDKSFFNIDKSTGEVSFNFAPDFENPLDSDGDNTYEVGVKVVDGAGFTDTQLLRVKVKDVVEDTPDDPGNPDPNPGEVVQIGDDGDNTLRGSDENEMFSGGAGNDVILAGGGNDRLNGTDKFSRGVGEIDNLNGEAGRDVFLLGDQDGSFYVGGEFADFAIVRDFSSGEDRFVLSGSSSDYRVADGSNGNAFILTQNGNDAVANVLNQSAADLNLDSQDFIYV